MINRTSPLKVLTVAMLSFIAFAPSAYANGDICDPQIVSGVAAIQKEALEEAAKNSEKLFGGHLEQPDWLSNSDGLLTACMSNNWPQINVSQPALQVIISRAQEKATKEACNQARKAVTDASKKYQNMLKTIPGYSTLNGSNNLGSWGNIAGISGGSTGGVSSVIGGNNEVDWGSLINSGIDRVGGTNIPGLSESERRRIVNEAAKAQQSSQSTPPGI